MSEVIWLHEDALSATHPVWRAAPDGSPCIHVWDNAYLQAQDYSLKRLVFLYETLLELPLEIIAADTLVFWRNHPAAHIWVPETPNPWVQAILASLCEIKQVTPVPATSLVQLPEPLRATRFHHYWKQVQAQLIAKG